jgi:phospholipid/cholesterol/gamma-HCH transport system substrate-binding protein
VFKGVYKLKNEISDKIKMGIFISLGLALFFAGIYFIGTRQQMFTGTFHINAVFNDVSGIQAGNNVRFSGVNIGTIENIKIISKTSVCVTMTIDESERKFITKDAEADITTEGLMGNKILIINPGTSESKEIENNDFITAAEPIKIDDILKQLKKTGDNSAHITGDLSEMADNIHSGKGTLGKLLMDSTYLKIPIENAAQMTQNLSEIVDRLRAGKGTLGKLLMDSLDLEVPIENAAKITKDLSEIVSSIRSGKGTLGKLIMDSTYLKIPLDNVVQITSDLSKIVSGLRSGKGTLGKLANDDEFYEHLDHTIKSLDSLLRDFKANPGRYVKVSVF